VVNAIDAMREADCRGEIVIAGEPIGDRVCVRVIDQGPGIDERIAGEIFRPFVSTKAMGTGLGLTIAKKIIEQHNGSVELARGPGGGTTARIELPMAPPEVD